MPLWAIIVIVVVVVIVLLAIGGAAANARRQQRSEEEFHKRVDEANHALAVAHADDKGWERTHLDAAARSALEQRRPGATPSLLELIEVIDRPGIDEDQAVFHAVVDGDDLRLVLDRTAEGWAAEPVQ